MKLLSGKSKTVTTGGAASPRADASPASAAPLPPLLIACVPPLAELGGPPPAFSAPLPPFSPSILLLASPAPTVGAVTTL